MCLISPTGMLHCYKKSCAVCVWVGGCLCSHGYLIIMGKFRTNFTNNKTANHSGFKFCICLTQSQTRNFQENLLMHPNSFAIATQMPPSAQKTHDWLRPDNSQLVKIQKCWYNHETQYRSIKYRMKWQQQKYIVGNKKEHNSSRNFLLQILPQMYLTEIWL
jgi:hypothetical protein